jgi:hypothetical protein
MMSESGSLGTQLCFHLTNTSPSTSFMSKFSSPFLLLSFLLSITLHSLSQGGGTWFEVCTSVVQGPGLKV